MKTTVKDLTIEQKLKLLCGKDFWHNDDADGKIPCLRMADASMGIRIPDESNDWNGAPSVAYPSMQMLAHTWNTDIAREYAECVADDCLDAGADIVLGPGVNIKRDPLCGRNFEYLSEDPYLAGVMAREYVSGCQAEGAGACVKHFCANNSEYNRLRQSSDVDERTLREIYYKPFEIACEASPVAVMCSYNRVNGVYASEYEKGYGVLRNEYGFDGIIVSDWGAVHDRTASAKAGLDLEMPFDEKNYEKLVEDRKSGRISEREIDACVRRIVDFAYRCKALQEKKTRKHTQKARIEFTQKAEEEGIVLLKNNGVLPLKHKRISVCGLYARPLKRPELISGGGSGRVQRITPVFDVTEIMSGRGYDVLYEPAFDDKGVDGSFMTPAAAVTNAALSDVNIVFAGTGANIESEGFDRTSMRLSAAQEKTILDTAAVNENTVVVLFAGAPVDMSGWIDKAAAVLYVGFPGEKGGEAIANILTGKVNPSGKLAETFPISYADTPSAKGYADSRVTVYREGLFVGYRYYDSYGIPVLFPFGHGLSYSKFDYKNLKLEASGETLEAAFDVRNVSDVDGKEVSQVYVRALAPCVSRPYKELKGFAKTFVKAGETETVKIKLGLDAFEYYSVARGSSAADDGVYEVIVGASSKDVKLKSKVRIDGGKILLLEKSSACDPHRGGNMD